MKKTIITFGLISGAISSLFLFSFIFRGKEINFEADELIGYAAIVLSFILVYFGIRSYRDNFGGGTITFGKAFKVGILITLLSSACYVISWLIVYNFFIPDFMDQYANYYIEKLKAGGASQESLTKAVNEMNQYKEMYKSPVIIAAMTFLEPFPVGLIITLLSSFILKRKTVSPVAA